MKDFPGQLNGLDNRLPLLRSPPVEDVLPGLDQNLL